MFRPTPAVFFIIYLLVGGRLSLTLDSHRQVFLFHYYFLFFHTILIRRRGKKKEKEERCERNDAQMNKDKKGKFWASHIFLSFSFTGSSSTAG